MATAETVLPRSADWALSNPWPWVLAGVAACGAGFLWAQLISHDAQLHGWLVGLGVLAVVVGLCLRCRAGDVAFLMQLSPAGRQRAIGGLVVVFGLMAVVVSVLPLGISMRMFWLPWDNSELIWLWLVVAPWCAAWVLWFQKARASGTIEGRTEAMALLTLAALGFFLACWALYDSRDPLAWDSARLFLGVAALVAYLGGVIAAGTSRVRKLLLSVVLLAHLGGVVVAVAAAPPGPFLARVVWVQVYRQYLEFMHLNNAYRFYSPEPSPATQLWFRLEYYPDNGEPFSHWVKLPDVNEDGETKGYTVELQYYRRLMLTENASRVFTGQISPKSAEHLLISGIPLPPDPSIPRYQPPSHLTKKLTGTFARHICEQSPPKHPGLKASYVKVYRVYHRWVNPGDFAQGMDPKDLTLYHPYYQGKFNSLGELVEPNDLSLYCLLPFVREDPSRPKESPIIASIYRHSGDLNHVRLTTKGKPMR
jgi:hypothetical protein